MGPQVLLLKPNAGAHSCATMPSDHISARMVYGATMISYHFISSMTYLMWREEHLWNVSALQRVHLSNLIIKILRAK
jgi:hypothetical protein